MTVEESIASIFQHFYRDCDNIVNVLGCVDFCVKIYTGKLDSSLILSSNFIQGSQFNL